MAEKTLMKGNEALAEGAVRAGCRFFAGYPITPQNEVPEYMSWRLPQEGGFFIQAESEVAAINMIFGAASTGIRVMTSSSSPGISLKQEGISYCAAADLPIFYANVVRGGPGLGNIAPAQSDYFQSTRGGGHGDYRVFVMAPNSATEMANFPKRCYDVAFKYRVPSMILADGLLGQMMEPVEFDFEPIDPGSIPAPDWALGVATGRNKRVVKSYDLRPGRLEDWNIERQKKFEMIEAEECDWDGEGLEDCELLVSSYGSCSRISKSAVKLARDSGLAVGLLRPITLYPFPKKIFRDMARKVKNILVVEMSLGQYVEDVQLSVEGAVPIHFHGRPGGGIPTAEEIFEIVKKIMRK